MNIYQESGDELTRDEEKKFEIITKLMKYRGQLELCKAEFGRWRSNVAQIEIVIEEYEKRARLIEEGQTEFEV